MEVIEATRTDDHRTEAGYIDEAIELLEKANAGLEPELLSVPEAKQRLASFARARRLVDYGIAALAATVENAAQVAQTTGTSIGQAKDAITTGEVLRNAPELNAALQQGEVSLDQASTIATAEQALPGAAAALLEVARKESFHVLRDRARKVTLEAEQQRGLGERQRRARSARSFVDGLGMVDIHVRLEPHVGTPIVARAEAQAQRLARAAGKGCKEPFEAHLADAYATMLAGSAVKPRGRRPELVVVVSHEVVTRGWTDVREGEVCKIPGVGPVSPQVVRDIACDAFLSGVLFDGTDLRNFKRWSRHIPVEVAIALELGDPPDFDGVSCVDCGNRFRTEFDHVEPHVARGPASTGNLNPRCWSCHQEKTERDRKAGKLKPPEP